MVRTLIFSSHILNAMSDEKQCLNIGTFSFAFCNKWFLLRLHHLIPDLITTGILQAYVNFPTSIPVADCSLSVAVHLSAHGSGKFMRVGLYHGVACRIRNCIMLPGDQHRWAQIHLCRCDK